MERDYSAMRSVLAVAAHRGGPASYGDFFKTNVDEPTLKLELRRLESDGLIDSSIRFFDGDGLCLGGAASITEEGERFFRLIENNRVWQIVLDTLDAADIDVSYPLLREVCEEIVKRYVSSFIPEIAPKK